MTIVLALEIGRSGALGASTKGELAPPWTPQLLTVISAVSFVVASAS